MGALRPAVPVQPIVGLLAASPALLDAARAALAEVVAPPALASPARAWTQSDYYRAEMGEALWRQYLALDALMAPHDLADLKRLTNELEARWCVGERRAVNIDPGYLDLLRIVLASTKDAAHRVAIADGLYAEATLRFAHGRFEPWPYTYPDYAGADALDFFTSARAAWRLRRELKGRTWDGRPTWRRGTVSPA